MEHGFFDNVIMALAILNKGWIWIIRGIMSCFFLYHMAIPDTEASSTVRIIKGNYSDINMPEWENLCLNNFLL